MLAAGQIMKASDLPIALRPLETLDTQTLIERGGSAVIAPDGRYVAGPVFDEEIILYATLDLQEIERESMTMDVIGHYSRPDIALALVVAGFGLAAAQTPAVGAKAPDFTLQTPTGNAVDLAKERAKGTTVLVLLRGFPGYQCPYCVKQVHDFVEHSADFAAKKSQRRPRLSRSAGRSRSACKGFPCEASRPSV